MKKFRVCAFLFVFISLIIFIIVFIGAYFSDRVDVYMKSKSENYCSSLVSDILREEAINIISDDLVSVKYEKENVLKSISINTKLVNSFLKNLNDSLLESIKYIENADIKIPLGIILGETLFGTLGPYFDIDIILLSSFKTDVFTKISEYGINSSLFELYASVNFTIRSMIPLREEISVIGVSFPLVIEIINGEVPRYYYNTNDIVPDVYDPN